MYRPLVVGLVFALLPAAPLLADPKPEKITIATWNLEWFFDNNTGDNYAKLAKEQSAPSREEWDWKLALVAKAIAEMQPTILALQEIENQRVLFYLTRKLKEDHGLDYKIAFVEGTDYFTEQDVALLYRGGLVEVGRREMSKEMFDSKLFYGLSKHVLARFEWGLGDDLQKLTLLNVHFRATAEGGTFRQKQARLARHWLAEQISRGENVVIIGDLNPEESYEETTKESEVGILRGLDTPSLDDDLADLHEHLPKDQRITHMIGKQFDRILVSRPLVANDPAKTDLMFKTIRRRQDLCVRGKQQDKDHWNIYYTIPQEERDVSDHYPLVAEFAFK